MSIPEPPGTPDPWQPPVEGAVPPPPPASSGGLPPGGLPPVGTPTYPPAGQPGTFAAAPRSSGKATAILVLGIVSLVTSCLWGLGLMPAIVALALAPGAKYEMAVSGGTLTGDGFIKAGVICSWVTVGLVVVGILGFIALLALGSATDATFTTTNDEVEETGIGVVAMLASLPLLVPTLRRLRP